MKGTEYSVALVIPPTSPRSVEWWKYQAATTLDTLARRHGRELRGRPRYRLVRGPVSTVTVVCDTRPVTR
ncbi:hypothetical protein [Actinomyces provencensis]|uniref:hypothetical protein n=1 Tax=Actinomyces provencensis TaxID=1720198 RepID=UPI00096A5C8A|nr:hypothetical protein [Actinomyces provencensis]